MFARMSPSAFCSAPGVSAKKAGVGFGFGVTTLLRMMFWEPASAIFSSVQHASA